MKALLLFPKKYSLASLLEKGLKQNGFVVKTIDFTDVMSRRLNYLYDKTVGLPTKLTIKWKNYFYNMLNEKYLLEFNVFNPDVVFIYNNQFVFPETLRYFKRTAKISFLLGDNPLYSNTFKYNLDILHYSDCTICYDSNWLEQLKIIGIPNVHLDFMGVDNEIFFPTKDIPSNLKAKYSSEALFIGRGHEGASATKRAMFYNSIRIDTFKLFGSSEWLKIIIEYPYLQQVFNLQNHRISDSELNIALNCSLISPIEQNRTIINGIHNRVFESIGAGILPVVEWRKDLDTVFGSVIPTIKNYTKINSKIKYFLTHEKERIERVDELRSLLKDNYQPYLFVKRINTLLYK